MNLQDRLEELKQMGNYDVSLTYGEGIGCDDSNMAPSERRCIVVMTPVGCIGEAKIMFYGKMKEFMSFDLKTKPVVISNPPKSDEYEKSGYFIWGTETGVSTILSKPFHGSWKEVDNGI